MEVTKKHSVRNFSNFRFLPIGTSLLLNFHQIMVLTSGDHDHAIVKRYFWGNFSPPPPVDMEASGEVLLNLTNRQFTRIMLIL